MILADARAADPVFVTAARRDNEAWFFFNNPPLVQRYDLKLRQWLAPVTLPLAQGESVLTAAVSLEKIYVAVGTTTGAGAAIRVFNTDGSDGKALNSVRWKASALYLDGDLLIAVAPADYNRQLFSQINIFDRASGERLSEFSSYSPITAVSVIPALGRIVGHNAELRNLNYMDYNRQGARTDLSKASYPGSTPPFRMWTVGTGSDARLVDSNGYVFSANLNPLGRLGQEVGAIDRMVDGSFVISRTLIGYQIARYSAGLEFVAQATLPFRASNVWICGDYALAFGQNAKLATGFEVQVVALSSLTPPVPPPATPAPILATPVLTSAVVGVDGAVTLTWEPVANAVAYQIERTSDPEAGNYWLSIARVADGALTFTDTHTEPGAKYFYHVVAASADGTGSRESNNIQVSIPESPGDSTPTPPPTEPDN
ncbi:MAG: hypothetical protein ACREKL_05620, partial [Chthoniobacterales bacterium]